MTTLTAVPEGRRTFIVTMVTSAALLVTVGLMSTLSDASRPAPVMADATPPGVRDAVIIPADQYDSLFASPVVAAAAPAITPAPVTEVATAEAPAPASAKPVHASLAVAADSQAEPAAVEAPDRDGMAPVRPIKVALAMATDDDDGR